METMRPPLTEQVLRDQHTYHAKKELAPGISLNLFYVYADEAVGTPFWAAFGTEREWLGHNMMQFASYQAMMDAVGIPASRFTVERRYSWDGPTD